MRKEDGTMREDSHGGDIYSQPVRLDFSVNVNPMGIPEGVVRAAADSISRCASYPDSRCLALSRALAEKKGVRKAQIVWGNGAADLIFGLALALKPKGALTAAPTFSEYGHALRAAGCETDEFFLPPKEGFALTKEGFEQALKGQIAAGRKPELVFLCNPNNPTGRAVSRGQMEEIARMCLKEQIYLAVDQCFEDFLEEPEKVSLTPVLDQFPNLVILGAFTKIYAMAGLRLGYALCGDEKVAATLKKVRQPWSVSTVAQEAGLAALKEEDYRRQAGRQAARGRSQLKEGLEKLGFQVYPSDVNFLLFRAPESWEGERLKRELLKRGILIRGCGNFKGLDPSFYRVCVRLPQENEELLKAIREIVEEGSKT